MKGGPLVIRLLGGFGVDVAGSPVPNSAWRLRKARSLVKLAALTPGRRIHRERACELLWPDRDAAAAANNFHQALHHARRALETACEGAGAALELRDDALSLDPTAEVDVDRFEAEIAAARETADPDAYERAISSHGGELLPEDRYEAWAQARREAVCELQLAALGEMAGLRATAGDHGAAGAAFQRALLVDPLHEAAHRGLMRAYAAAGRRQRALDQYQQLRQALRREYEGDPDPETRRLYRELLSDDAPGPAAVADPEPELPLARAARANPNNLPLQLTSFVGRERELAELGRLLTRTRLLTIAGPGGCGKTRLAIETAARALPGWPGGVWLAELAPIADSALVAEAVAAALGAQLPPTAAAEEALVAAIGERSSLLVLDNCEHVIARCAELAEHLLRSCPGLSILATSREPLHCGGEVAWRVPSLRLPDPAMLPPVAELARYEAIHLFAARAAAVSAGFELTAANAGDVCDLCVRLDGIPLAIELAAARVRILSPRQIVERLSRSLEVLGAGARTGAVAPADADGHRALERAAARRGGAAAFPAPRGVRRHLRTRCCRGGLRRDGADRRRCARPARAPGRQVAGPRRGAGRRGALPAARDVPAVRGPGARRRRRAERDRAPAPRLVLRPGNADRARNRAGRAPGRAAARAHRDRQHPRRAAHRYRPLAGRGRDPGGRPAAAVARLGAPGRGTALATSCARRPSAARRGPGARAAGAQRRGLPARPAPRPAAGDRRDDRGAARA